MFKFSDKIDQRKLAEYQKEEVIAKMLRVDFQAVSRVKLKEPMLSDVFANAVDYGMNLSIHTSVLWGATITGVMFGLAGSYLIPVVCLAAAYYSEKQKQKFQELVDQGAEWFRNGGDQGNGSDPSP